MSSSENYSHFDGLMMCHCLRRLFKEPQLQLCFVPPPASFVRPSIQKKKEKKERSSFTEFFNSPLCALRLRQTQKKNQGQLTTGVICQADRGSVNYEVPCCDNLWSKSIKQVLFAQCNELLPSAKSLGNVGGTGTVAGDRSADNFFGDFCWICFWVQLDQFEPI